MAVTGRQIISKRRNEQLKREAALAAAMALLYLPAEAAILAAIHRKRHVWGSLHYAKDWTGQQRADVATLSAFIVASLSHVAMEASGLVYRAKKESAAHGAYHAELNAQALGVAGVITALTGHDLRHIAIRTATSRALVSRYLDLARDTANRVGVVLQQREFTNLSTDAIEREMQDAITQTTRDEAIRIARAESWQSYGDAMVETYQANANVLKRWAWRAVLDERTCIACLVMDGQAFPIDTPFTPLHVGCRCMAEPILADNCPEWGETGKDWFRRQSVQDQQGTLGQAACKLYRDGIIKLEDLVDTAVTKDGTFHPVKSLKTLVREGKLTAEQYHAALKRT